MRTRALARMNAVVPAEELLSDYPGDGSGKEAKPTQRRMEGKQKTRAKKTGGKVKRKGGDLRRG